MTYALDSGVTKHNLLEKGIEIKCPEWQRGRQSEITRKFCQEIGAKEVTFHQLRATHITLALVDGVSTGIVMAYMGHSQLSTTNVYFCSSGIKMKGKTDVTGQGVRVN